MNRASCIRAVIAGLSGVLVYAAPAFAQDSVTAVCAAMQTEAERAACRRGVQAAQEAARQPVGDAPAAAGAQRPQASAPEDDVGFLGLGGIFRGTDERAPARAGGLGSNTLNPRSASGSGRDDLVTATLVSFREPLPGIMEFELDNGEVWRQTSGDGQDIHLARGRPVPVEMWSSWTGGFRMRLVGERQTVRVERLR